jgi:hypothetical protein
VLGSTRPTPLAAAGALGVGQGRHRKPPWNDREEPGETERDPDHGLFRDRMFMKEIENPPLIFPLSRRSGLHCQPPPRPLSLAK